MKDFRNDLLYFRFALPRYYNTLWFVLGIYGTVAFTVITYGMYLYQPIYPPSNHDPKSIKYAKEYQIPLQKAEFVNRNEGIERWINRMNQLSHHFNVSMNDMQNRAYSQHHFAAGGSNHCRANRHVHLRLRNFTDGEYAGTSAIDLKRNGYAWEACDPGWPYWPSSKYISSAVQKCENDVHACFSKHSRVTKIIFPEHRGFWKCSQLIELFPWAFTELPAHEHENSVKARGTGWVSISDFDGVLFGDTKFTITFDIRYGSRERALAGLTRPSSGEFSIRVSPLKRPYTSPNEVVYNKEALQVINDVFFQMVLDFEKDKIDLECAKTYFDTGYHASLKPHY